MIDSDIRIQTQVKDVGDTLPTSSVDSIVLALHDPMLMDVKRARTAFAAGNAAGVSEELTALFPNDPEIRRISEFVKFAIFGGTIPDNTSPETRTFLQNIAAASPQSRLLRQPSRHYLPRELDFIADLEGTTGWSVAQALNRLTLDNLDPRYRSAVVVTMRDDGIYIIEWVAHYLALGFEHIFVYTNDNSDSSDLLFSLLADRGIITLIKNEVTGEVPPEAKAFGHALHLLPELRDYEWVLFVDSDEFLVIAPEYKHAVNNVLDAVDSKFPNQAVAGICYDWLWFISDMIFERKPGLLCERFQHARPHWLSKCFIRVKNVQSMRQQHYPEVLPNFLVVDSIFTPLNTDTIWERKEAQYRGGRLNHYWPRSFQEFAVKKARGASLGGESNLYDRPYNQFFTWNGYSESGNRYPTDPLLLERIKIKISELRQDTFVASAADRISNDFLPFLNRIADERQLRDAYEHNATEPGDL